MIGYLVANTRPDDVVLLTVVRGSETLEIPVTLGERP
jgi:S1-C subfamily serine protease